jgi:imidazole glycerol phosphate synthase glutamine amidotransferase subunit
VSALPISIVATGTANTASVVAGLRRAGGDPRLTDEPRDIERAAAVVLPGVGTLHAAMTGLRARGLDDILARRIREGRATLAVCLGLQLLCEASDESPGVAGLGILAARVGRLTGDVRVPHMGWNLVTPAAVAGSLVESGYAYFANSYRLQAEPEGWHASVVDYGGTWIAALERGAVLACQFHPELSGAWGTALLQRWIARAGGVPC